MSSVEARTWIAAGGQAGHRRLPWWSWLGLAVMVASEALTLATVEPFYSWHTPIAWTAYILLVDGVVWKRRGRSWLKSAPAELLFLAAASVPLWLVFEIYNACCLQNWHYIGLPESLPIRYIGYVWAFATISPALFETGDLIASLRPDGTGGVDEYPPRPFGGWGWVSVVCGAVMLAIPLVHPSAWLAAPVWLGFIFLLDPINARVGLPSIRNDLRTGHRARLVNLMFAGLACGLIWEFWNYWAGAKWKYTVPILPSLKLFEMPIAGFGGFPPFAVECFVMYVTLRWLLWRGARYPISI
jgi:hypothetical protein